MLSLESETSSSSNAVNWPSSMLAANRFCLSLPQEPPEDEANIIEKILSVRIAKKEVNYFMNKWNISCGLWMKYVFFSSENLLYFNSLPLSLPRLHHQRTKWRRQRSFMSSTEICESPFIIYIYRHFIYLPTHNTVSCVFAVCEQWGLCCAHWGRSTGGGRVQTKRQPPGLKNERGRLRQA